MQTNRNLPCRFSNNLRADGSSVPLRFADDKGNLTDGSKPNNQSMSPAIIECLCGSRVDVTGLEATQSVRLYYLEASHSKLT